MGSRSIGRQIRPRLVFSLAALLACALVSGASAEDRGPGDCLGCHGAGRSEGGVDSLLFRASAHSVLDCTDCHSGALEEPHPSGDMEVLDCSACHDTEAFGESVHGALLDIENVCLRCHDVHATVLMDSLTARDRVAMCTQCHEDAGLMKSHGVGLEWARGYRQSFHGRAIRMGNDRVADCMTCHTAHEVRTAEDTLSTVHPRNLLKTCRAEECHPRATDAFLRGSVHGIYGGTRGQVVRVVRGFYILAIAVIVGAMFLHNVLDLFARWREGRRRKASRGTRGETVLRWTVGERVQHGLLAASFAVLAATGFLAFLPVESVSAWPGMGWLLAERRALHLGAAAVLILSSLYHLAYLTFTRRGREQWREVRPRATDVRETLGAVAHLFGRRPDRPAKGRFGYAEKVEYFSVLWGTAAMTVTGIVMAMAEVFPLFLVDLARLIHRWEAILAVLAIAVWHLYAAHWRPGVFPMDRSWLDGRISLEEWKREHALEYERAQERDRTA